MGIIRYFLFLLVIASSALFSQVQLKKGDVKTNFQELLNFHVEHQEINPLLLGRALKIYIEQFDSSKMYLLEDEAKAFFQLSSKRLEEGVRRYKTDDHSDFIELNALAQKAIARARQWRAEGWKELILSTQDLKETLGETHLSYAPTEIQLRTRIRKQLIRILLEEKQFNQMDEWSPTQREKIAHLWEKRFERKEESYFNGDEHHLALNTLRALAKSLDAHTAYFSPVEAQEMRTSLEKQFEGVGVMLRESINGVVVAEVVKGGPADQSKKIFPGDTIIQVDGVPVAGMNYQEVLESMKGKDKNGVKLTLRGKADQKLKEVTLTREKIKMDDERLQYKSHPYGSGHIGILTLPSFYEGGFQSNAERDIREAIKKLKSEGTLKGIVLDMRENSGGFLSQAVKIAGLFMSKGVVVISKYSKGEIKYLRNLDDKTYFDGPLVVLTSKASASAAEIVAQALQDYGSALIVGDEHTYGKGTIQYQTVTDKEAKAFYKVTVGRYYTVSGRSTQIEGVKADIVIPTIFSFYKIGERFLDYPLANDQVAAAYIDPLTDIDHRNRLWFQKNYLPNLHQYQERWKMSLPVLKVNSEERLKKDKNFSLFLKTQNKKKDRSVKGYQKESNSPWGHEDLQMVEAVNVLKDMIYLQN